MDPLDFVTEEQLKECLHLNKTKMSLMEPPHIFLNQLRDHNLLPENMYKKVIKMKSAHLKQKRVYELLDWLERRRPQHIKLFWKCVFKDHLLLQYPTLRQLRSSLMDGSFTEQLPEKVEEAEKEQEKTTMSAPEQEKKTVTSPEQEKKTVTSPEQEKKRRREETMEKKDKTRGVSLDEEQAGPSSLHSPHKRKKVQKPSSELPSKSQDRTIWTKPLYKTQLPVTCGAQEGLLIRDKLARGEKCIVVQDRWFTPSGFEELAGKKSWRNWKQSIRCQDISLGKLIKQGQLTSPGFTRNKNHNPKV
ncbi:autoimmune regulator-like [Osmerus eperlanus]|uniref:autoimmune regulator-like n=1 Tax=Osmerus eperlanus TaxID=29151 RepID=UPI002E0DE9D3